MILHSRQCDGMPSWILFPLTLIVHTNDKIKLDETKNMEIHNAIISLFIVLIVSIFNSYKKKSLKKIIILQWKMQNIPQCITKYSPLYTTYYFPSLNTIYYFPSLGLHD
jgi:hypothetical protein